MVTGRIRAAFALAIGAAVAITGALIGPTGVLTTATPAQAAISFDAGNIIADSVFYNASTMSGDEIQSFLNSRVATCRSGYTCLKDYGQPTPDVAASAYCKAYKGWGGQRAADILHDVAVACNINPQALLVMLEKEQGLVTDSWPTSTQYRSAMGYGCPDTAACDSAYYGFFNQVYQAARRFQVYKAEPGSYKHKPFQNNAVRYHPNIACGSSTVYIQNYATAGLYNYTPYQPNSAALAAGVGVGDSCSAYGNRNFFNYFTKWFGSTQGIVQGAILGSYTSVYGGPTGLLGNATSTELCGLRNAGCFQQFEGGKFYWSPATGAHAIRADVLAKWVTTGYENGSLGYPVNDMNCGLKNDGCYQTFEFGQIHWSATTGAHITSGPIAGEWATTNWENGALGYPATDPICGIKDGGCYQYFELGQVHWSNATGAHLTQGAIRDAWGVYGWESGKLGYPKTDPTCDPSGMCRQSFQNGELYLSTASNVFWVKGAIGAAYGVVGSQTGALGYPTSGENCGLRAGGCFQYFQSGQIHWSPSTGAYPTSGAIKDTWGSVGWESGALGYPLSGVFCTLRNGGCIQFFEGGSIYQTPAGAFESLGGIRALYASLGYENGSLGFPTGHEVCTTNKSQCTQTYEHGTIIWTPTTGARVQ